MRPRRGSPRVDTQKESKLLHYVNAKPFRFFPFFLALKLRPLISFDGLFFLVSFLRSTFCKTFFYFTILEDLYFHVIAIHVHLDDAPPACKYCL